MLIERLNFISKTSAVIETLAQKEKKKKKESQLQTDSGNQTAQRKKPKQLNPPKPNKKNPKQSLQPIYHNVKKKKKIQYYKEIHDTTSELRNMGTIRLHPGQQSAAHYAFSN